MLPTALRHYLPIALEWEDAELRGKQTRNSHRNCPQLGRPADTRGCLARAQVPLQCILRWHLGAGSTGFCTKELPLLNIPGFLSSNEQLKTKRANKLGQGSICAYNWFVRAEGGGELGEKPLHVPPPPPTHPRSAGNPPCLLLKSW